jgi:hypothetical protein
MNPGHARCAFAEELPAFPKFEKHAHVFNVEHVKSNAIYNSLVRAASKAIAHALGILKQ